MSVDLEQIKQMVSCAVQQALAQDKQGLNEELFISKSNKVSNKRKSEETLTPSHALIFWIGEQKFSTITYKSIELNVDLVAELNKVYNINFNSKLYRGKVILTGSKQDCEKHYVGISSENDKEAIDEFVPTNKTQKKSNNKDCNEIHMLKNQKIELRDEIEVLKNKLIESQKIINDSKKDISNLKQEVNDEKEKNKTITNMFC